MRLSESCLVAPHDKQEAISAQLHFGGCLRFCSQLPHSLRRLRLLVHLKKLFCLQLVVEKPATLPLRVLLVLLQHHKRLNHVFLGLRRESFPVAHACSVALSDERHGHLFGAFPCSNFLRQNPGHKTLGKFHVRDDRLRCFASWRGIEPRDDTYTNQLIHWTDSMRRILPAFFRRRIVTRSKKVANNAA